MTQQIALPKAEFESRLHRTHGLMAERGLDGLIAFSSYGEREGHVCYLTNHRNSFPNVMSHIGLGHSAYVLGAQGEGTLVAPLGHQPEKVLGVAWAETGNNMVEGVASAINKMGLAERRIGIAGMDVIPTEYYASITETFPDAGLEDAGDILEGQRVIKSPAEQELLRRAAHVADVALAAGMAAAIEGATQHDIELAARKASLDAGVDFVVRVRVSSGKKVSTLGWPMVTSAVLEKGDVVYLDFIGWCDNYGFDNSRVTVVGPPTSAQQDYLEHLSDAVDWMVEVIKPGTEVMFPYTESRDRTIIPFGHGIGLEICENPWITMGRKTSIEPGMVMCVEPIVISQEFGGMNIEDTVLVSDDGVEVLNQCPRVFW
jgi:Xaa-Pro aminopeptidase